MKHFVTAFAALCLISSSAFALSDSEYKELMKDSNFAQKEKELSQIWTEAKAKLSAEHFTYLQKEQKEWLSTSRDKEAEDFLKAEKVSRAKAYADIADQRIDDIRGAIWAAEITPEDADENIFTRDGFQIEISLDKKTGILTANFDSDDDKTIWTAGGKLSGNVLTVSNEKGSAEIMYLDLNTVRVKSDEKLKGNGVKIDGEYQQFLNGAQIRNQKKYR